MVYDSDAEGNVFHHNTGKFNNNIAILQILTWVITGKSEMFLFYNFVHAAG